MSILVFTKPGCFGCKLSMKKLDDLKLPYQAVDVTQDEEGRQRVQELGYRQLPVVVAGDQHWSGFSPDRLTALADT